MAAQYDEHLAHELWMRRVIWGHLRRLFRPGDHVLDAGCGTGIDTLYLASRHVRVTAVDVSPRMLAQLRAKVAASPAYASLVEVRLGDLNAAAQSLPTKLDGIVSSFGALNTVDMAPFAAESARILRPGGHLLGHLLSPGYFRRGLRGVFTPNRREVALPAPRANAVKVNGQPVPHLLLTPRELYERFFARDFLWRGAHAVGLLVPPRLEKLLPPPLLDALGGIERLVGALPPLTARGRFFILHLQRRAC